MTTLGFIGLGFFELLLILLELLLILLILAMGAFWLWMLIDCVTKEEDQNQKIIWVILIAVVGIVGAPLYFFLRKLPRKKKA